MQSASFHQGIVIPGYVNPDGILGADNPSAIMPQHAGVPSGMSGHSKWSTIKRKKGATDAKRGQLFTKLAREITVAARTGIPDPDANARLRIAIQKARSESMPKDNIDRAVARAAGSNSADQYEEIYYEGYGPGGTAIMISTMTDNKNRTVGELRAVLVRAGGSLAENGSVSWMFDQTGVITITMGDHDEDELGMAAIEAGAIDFSVDEGVAEVYTAPSELHKVAEALTAVGFEYDNAELVMKPQNPLEPEVEQGVKAVRLLEKLEDLDDVQNVYSNLEISDEVMAQV
jgi:YebC/PmpR family DNA-binding regulatory protein